MTHRLHTVLIATCALALLLAGGAAASARLLTPAHPKAAVAETAYPQKFFGAVVPDIPTGAHAPKARTARIANLPYGGGPVMHRNRTHAIFWEPNGSPLHYDPGYQSLVEVFLRNVAADSRKPGNVYGLSGQYHDATGPAAYNSTFAGAVETTDGLPPNGCTEPLLPTGPGWLVCLSDSQLEAEIQAVVSANRLPTGSRDIYFLVLPNGMGTCETSGPENCALGGTAGGSFCGYHSTTPDETILYAVIPYNAVSGHCQSGNPRPNSSTADPAVSTISHEHNETVTDPLGTGWIDTAGNEDGDLCIQDYGPRLGGSGAAGWNEMIHGGRYWLQAEWSNQVGSCQAREAPDSISFAAPGHIRAHEKLSFTGRGRDPHGTIVTYTWFWGDGGRGSRRIASHAFAHAGTFRVILRTTDSSGNWAFAARTIQVTNAPAKDRRRGKR